MNWSFDTLQISIHAPPRGATPLTLLPSVDMVFQFTPLREGRPRQSRKEHRQTYFNSRPSARGDNDVVHFLRFHFISIHAPPRGATQRSGCRRTRARYFNSRPSARGDTVATAVAPIVNKFQFTPLREGRRARLRVCSAAQSDFNSRPSARGDQDTAALDTKQLLFQFTPLREGRRRPVGKLGTEN